MLNIERNIIEDELQEIAKKYQVNRKHSLLWRNNSETIKYNYYIDKKR